MDPLTAVTLGSAALSLGGTYLGIKGELDQGEANAAAAEYSARTAKQRIRLSRQQRKYVGKAAAEEERVFRQQTAKELGEIRSAYGASGVTTEGSAMDVLEESAASAELDALRVRHAGQMKIWELKQEEQFMKKEAAFNKRQAGFARSGAQTSAFGRGLSGAASAASILKEI